MKFTMQLSIYVSVVTLFSMGLCYGGSLFNSLRDSDDTVKRLPTSVVSTLIEYEERQADHKAAVVAVDPSGHYALGLAYNCDSLQEAESKALAQCMIQKDKYHIISEPYVCLLGNEYVYEEMVKNDLIAGDFQKREMYMKMKSDMMLSSMEMK